MQMMKRMSVATRVGLAMLGSAALGACAQNSDSTVPAAGATPAATTAPAGPKVLTDLSGDIDATGKKFVDLAKAMPEATYAWRPMPGTRSVREVMLHVASENYFLPSITGAAIPAASGLTSDYKTVEAYEKKELPRDSVVAQLEASFASIKQAIAADTAALGAEVDFFGTKMSRQAAWMSMVMHMHEHLGQAIAYARSNKVVPPWSK